MNTWTRFGLVLLRVVIGWHFLFEGIEKLDSWYHGPREGKPVWSAEGYLREAQGPLAWWFREQAGDPDADALARLTPEALQADATQPGALSKALETEWKDTFDRFVAYYELGKHKAVQPEFVGVLAPVPLPALVRSYRDPKLEQLQLTLAHDDFENAKFRALHWLVAGTREVPSKLPGVDGKVKETTPQRIADYKVKIAQLREMEADGMPAFNQDVWQTKYRQLKGDVSTSRTELLRDLNKPFKDALDAAKTRLNKTQRDKGPVPEPVAATTNLDRINFVTRWGVTIVGACLILGLFTRLSCVAGAAFLLMFYLAMPALPWLPLNPRAEGHYLFINKNIIEMIALLALATTQSGKWLGLDGLLQFLNPFRKRSAPPAPQRPRPLVHV
jgi:uncharacterized membrane protein YphA (DoxX/SURF4 family)